MPSSDSSRSRLAGLRRRTTLAVASALSLGGMALYVSGPPGVGRLRFAAWQVGAPAGWVQLESESWGNHFCFDDCPTHIRTYRVPAPVGQAAEDWAVHLDTQGIEGRPPELGDTSEERWGTWHRGRLRLEAVFIGPADADGQWEVEAGTSIVRVFWSGR